MVCTENYWRIVIYKSFPPKCFAAMIICRQKVLIRSCVLRKQCTILVGITSYHYVWGAVCVPEFVQSFFAYLIK